VYSGWSKIAYPYGWDAKILLDLFQSSVVCAWETKSERERGGRERDRLRQSDRLIFSVDDEKTFEGCKITCTSSSHCYVVVACGDYCLGCDTNGANRCDPTKCKTSALTTGVAYSNVTQTCEREYTPNREISGRSDVMRKFHWVWLVESRDGILINGSMIGGPSRTVKVSEKHKHILSHSVKNMAFLKQQVTGDSCLPNLCRIPFTSDAKWLHYI